MIQLWSTRQGKLVKGHLSRNDFFFFHLKRIKKRRDFFSVSRSYLYVRTRTVQTSWAHGRTNVKNHQNLRMAKQKEKRTPYFNNATKLLSDRASHNRPVHDFSQLIYNFLLFAAANILTHGIALIAIRICVCRQKCKRTKDLKETS